MSEKRTAHPYLMYDAIREQPERVARVVSTQRAVIEQAATAAARARRILLAGIGSSYHAAQVGEQFLRHFTGGAAQTSVEQSFELVHYPLQLGRDDALIAISHRGTNHYTLQSLTAARAAGTLTIAITGEPASEGMRAADFVATTCEHETCFAHTKSYTTALAALVLFAIYLARARGFVSEPDARGAVAALERVAELMRTALGCERVARHAAAQIARRQRWVFLGAGPNWATAREGALKAKETSYIASEGFQTEQFLHGPIVEMDSRAAATAVMAAGPGDHRTDAALRALGELGVLRVVTATHGADAGAPHDALLEVPQVSEWLSPFLHVVPLQLLSYYVAIERGSNPDTGRQHEPGHARAHDRFKL